MRTFAAFCAVFGLAAATELKTSRYDYNGELWKMEFDLVDFAKMNIKSTWESWKTDFGRSYENEGEELKRFGIFLDNLQYIARHNSGDDTSYRLRPNQFTDLTTEEFSVQMFGEKGRCFTGEYKNVPVLGKANSVGEKHSMANPASVDWEAQGKVTPVKNQGNCGSCWAFSVTGSTECQYAIKKGTLTSLSEQQLVDCSGSYGNAGCNGGEMDAAFKYIKANGGLCTESAYPYKGVDGTCKSSSCGTKYNANSGYTDVTKEDESALETAAVSGCVSVAIQANQAAFQSYSSGILTGNCGTSLDHGVLVVGYGTQGGQDYWKVKNSWGASWGENGYVLICKNCGKNGAQGECGINDDPSYPTF